MAHAIFGYDGACKYIHGHSYQLEVTVSNNEVMNAFIPKPGLLIDFKDIKKIVQKEVIELFDHQLVLSEEFVSNNAYPTTQDNLLIISWEPTAENLLICIQHKLSSAFPEKIKLVKLKLYETNDSFAEWFAES